jgi:hypothetical protein
MSFETSDEPHHESTELPSRTLERRFRRRELRNLYNSFFGFANGRGAFERLDGQSRLAVTRS